MGKRSHLSQPSWLFHSHPHATLQVIGYLSGCGSPSALSEPSPEIPETAGGTGLGFPGAARQGTASAQLGTVLSRDPIPRSLHS